MTSVARTERTATTKAAVIGIKLPQTATKEQHDFNLAVKHWIDLRQGRADAPFERALTVRDLGAELDNRRVLTMPPGRSAGILTVTSSGNATIASFDSLAEGIRSTKLITDIVKRIDDPTRFDDLHRRTRDALLAELAPITGRVSASIRTIQETFASAQESFAQTVTELQASVATAAAGVRQVSAASASANRAVATSVTQVTARLNDFGGAGATVEQTMTAIADRATGLEAQYVLKLAAGGYIAGIGLGVTAGGLGGAAPTSAMIVQADKFAIVDSSYVGGLDTTPPPENIMFGVDGDGAYVSGNLKVGGKAIIQGVTTTTVGDAALSVNATAGALHGIYVYSQPGGNAVYAVANDDASLTSAAVRGEALGSNTIGIDAVGTLGGTALKVSGPTVIGNHTITWNTRAIAAPTGDTSKFLRNDGTWENLAKAIFYVDASAPGTPGVQAGWAKVTSQDGTLTAWFPYYV
jgi:uncharacterized protein YukE